MWHFEHTIVTQAVPARIWALWKDVENWHTWDDDVQWSRLDGEFKEGGRGILKPKGGPRTRFVLTYVAPLVGFSDCSTLPLAKLCFSHRLEVTAEGTRMVHRVDFSGPLGWLFARWLGPGFTQGLPQAMERLARLAEQP